MALLSQTPTTPPEGLNKKDVKEELRQLRQQLKDLQNRLYAGSRHAVLLILQGMDASGKDNAIKHVFSGVNPQGVQVTSFKTPTPEEQKHDFLWRIHPHAPAKGMLQVFNRSHYEDVLITRVHGWCSNETARQRFRSINDFETLLQEQNQTLILKFYLHISPERQQEKLAKRLQNPAKNWKYDAHDADEARHWQQYMQMYEDVFAHCSHVPWTLVPSDRNWYKNYIIAKTLVNALAALDLHYPIVEKKTA